MFGCDSEMCEVKCGVVLCGVCLSFLRYVGVHVSHRRVTTAGVEVCFYWAVKMVGSEMRDMLFIFTSLLSNE
jgi:hypothetical protein